jgi:signal transduction histidine kinase
MRPAVQVLVVEDNPGDAKLIALALAESTRPKFASTCVATLAAAIAHLQKGAHTDVVLLDLSLPDATGEDTVVQMRAAAPELPIVIMTGLDDAMFAERMVALGAQDYLIKGDATALMMSRAVRHAITRMRQAIERESLVKELRVSVETQNRMFGILAHDLRNPVGVIGGYAEFIELTEEGKLSDIMKSALRSIREGAAHMNDLIEDALALAVAEAGQISVVRRRLDLGELARKAANLAAVAATRKLVRVVVEGGPAWIAVDAVKIEQVLNNLIGNAIKFSKEGDVITISVATDGAGHACLSVADQGGGIPDEVKANLFKPFVKGKTGTAGERSNGLGLYICSRIIDAHGGTITAESEDGRGTTFTVRVPPSAEY